MEPCIVPVMSRTHENDFLFLNQAKSFPMGEINWASQDMPRLWRYNLHYFDFILDKGRSEDSVKHLISDWIDQNPPGTQTAWEPYTVSLRIVNWIKLFLREDFRKSVEQKWLDSLYLQARWLEKHIEYHILANHYLKNGVALFFAGMYFDGDDAQRWLRKGQKILQEEMDEQFLSDGGHYERSPMYHSICVEDYLDVLNLAQNSGFTDSRLVRELQRRIPRTLTFLNDISMPDGKISLFNDSAFGIARSPDQLFNYAKQVIGYENPPKPSGLSLIEKPESGYFGFRDKADMLIVDCGEVGPDYQPGHAHCDMLSYELMLDGKRVIVDSGVYDYEAGEMRQFVRSTRAHNTIMVDGTEQSEIWGAFRMARRARPLAAHIEKTGPDASRFVGEHDGYKRLPGQVIHKRTINYGAATGWSIRDQLQGRGRHDVENFIHLHPDFRPIAEGRMIYLVNDQGQSIATIHVKGEVDVSLEKAWYCPEFGLRVENDVIKMSAPRELPFEMTYQIKKA